MSEKWGDKSEAIRMLERILAKCVRKPTGCLVCYQGLDRNGYSNIRFKTGGRKYRTARLMMHLVKGFDLSSPLEVCHNEKVCKSKACVEVDHLRVDTHRSNLLEQMKRLGPIRSRRKNV